jgi:cell division septation protein DedD
LPNDVKPGDVIDLRQTIQAPDHPGTYVLEITLVQEGNAWFPEIDSANKVAMPVIVTDGTTPPAQVAAAVAKATPSSEVKQVKSKSDNLSAEEKKERKLRREKRREERAKAAKEKAAKEKAPADSQKGAWAVQVGSFAKEKDAKAAADRLKDKGHDAYVVTSDVDGKRWYRVRVGHVATKADAEALQKKLSTEKASQSLVVMNK